MGNHQKNFTQSWLEQGGSEVSISKSKQRYYRRGVWQRRFWEHTLSCQADYSQHFDYLHYNPIKHGIVKHLSAYPYSLCVINFLTAPCSLFYKRHYLT